MFLNSNPVFHCRCVAAVCLPPGLSVLAHISRLFRMCRILLAFWFLPAFRHRFPRHNHHRCHFLPAFCFARFLVYRSGCPEGFHPNGHTSRTVRVDSAGF